MEIRIEQLKARPRKVVFADSVDSFPALHELVAAGAVSFRGDIRAELVAELIGALVEVEGTLSFTVVLPCSRCLQSAEQRLEVPLVLSFSRQSPQVNVSDEECELTEDEVGLIVFDGDTIDLRSPLEQELLMAVPQHPLCRDDCPGLCPVCGVDLNQQQCGCSSPQFHGALAALKNFKVVKD
jgi:uncharacterized protein